MSIPGYNISRCDRAGRGGGVLLFSREDILLGDTGRFDDGICQVLFCEFELAKTLLFIFYRPPDAPEMSFSNALNFLKSCMLKYDDNFQTCILGDFNFPNVDWSSDTIVSTSAMQSAQLLLGLRHELLLNQYVLVPTRGSNILDLCFCSNPFLVINSSM